MSLERLQDGPERAGLDHGRQQPRCETVSARQAAQTHGHRRPTIFIHHVCHGSTAIVLDLRFVGVRKHGSDQRLGSLHICTTVAAP